MRPRFAMPWIHIVLYAALLAGGTVALQWLDYQRLVRSYPSAIYDGLLATGFLALGLWLGMRWASARASWKCCRRSPPDIPTRRSPCGCMCRPIR